MTMSGIHLSQDEQQTLTRVISGTPAVTSKVPKPATSSCFHTAKMQELILSDVSKPDTGEAKSTAQNPKSIKNE